MVVIIVKYCINNIITNATGSDQQGSSFFDRRGRCGDRFGCTVCLLLSRRTSPKCSEARRAQRFSSESGNILTAPRCCCCCILCSPSLHFSPAWSSSWSPAWCSPSTWTQVTSSGRTESPAAYSGSHWRCTGSSTPIKECEWLPFYLPMYSFAGCVKVSFSVTRLRLTTERINSIFLKSY